MHQFVITQLPTPLHQAMIEERRAQLGAHPVGAGTLTAGGTFDPAEGLERLVEVIKAIQDDFAKIIVITHLRELKNSFETHIEVKKDPVRGSFYQIL